MCRRRGVERLKSGDRSKSKERRSYSRGARYPRKRDRREQTPKKRRDDRYNSVYRVCEEMSGSEADESIKRRSISREPSPKRRRPEPRSRDSRRDRKTVLGIRCRAKTILTEKSQAVGRSDRRN